MDFLVGKRAPWISRDSPPPQVAADRQQELIDAAGLRIASKAGATLAGGRNAHSWSKNHSFFGKKNWKRGALFERHERPSINEIKMIFYEFS